MPERRGFNSINPMTRMTYNSIEAQLSKLKLLHRFEAPNSLHGSIVYFNCGNQEHYGGTKNYGFPSTPTVGAAFDCRLSKLKNARASGIKAAARCNAFRISKRVNGMRMIGFKARFTSFLACAAVRSVVVVHRFR